MLATSTTAAKEEMLSSFALWCAETCISASECEGKKPRLGFASKNPALHRGVEWSKSTLALGLPEWAGKTASGPAVAANNVATIQVADPKYSLQNFCSHQANMAALNSLLPGLANAIQGDYRPIAATATSEAVQDYALDTAANSTSFLLAVRSWTGIPMSVTSKILSGIGYAGMVYSGYQAMKAMQAEYAACMQ